MPEAVKGTEANTKVPNKKKNQQLIWWIGGGAVLVLVLVIWFTSRSSANAASGAETASTNAGATGIAGTLATLESMGLLSGSAAGGSVGVTGAAGPAGAAGPTGATGSAGKTGATGPAGKSPSIPWTTAQEKTAWGKNRSAGELGKLFIGGKWYSGIPKPALSSSPYASGGTYTVKPGDSIQGIARRFNIPGGWQNLYKINQGMIGAHPVIYPGMRLKI
jgi:LysM domain-containing protein